MPSLSCSLVSILPVLGSVLGSVSTEPSEAGFHFIDVGQGSALLIRDEQGDVVLVDSGPSGAAEAVLAAIVEEGPGEVGLWIHTHFDADHVGGFARVVAGLDGIWPSEDDVEVVTVWDRGVTGTVPETDASDLYFGLVGERRTSPAPGATYATPGLRIEVLELDGPPLATNSPENARGLALCVELGTLRALLPGDLPRDRLELAAAACGPVDLLWMSHHGSADAISAAVIELADPRVIVISAGHQNAYCHPSPRALALVHDRPVWLLDGAGIEPTGACPPLAEMLGPEHRLVGGDLWIDAQRGAWVGAPRVGWLGLE